jgi:protein arginine kinase
LKAGNGFRVSLLMHLPAISIKKRISAILPEMKKNNIVLEGTLGGHNKTLGHMYHLYNAYPSTGNEEEIKNNINTAARGLISIEDGLRDDILKNGKLELEDRIWKSFGLLKYCKKISYSDAMDHLAFIRLGIILASITKIELVDVNKLLVMIQFAHLQNYFNMDFSSHNESDVYRALLIQEYLLKAG